jgi:carbonic anhydrase
VHAVLGAEPGAVAAIRNVGGRVTPGVLMEPAMLRRVTQAAAGSRSRAQAVSDPRAAVALDLAALRAETRVAGVRISGLVYDVASGLIDTVVTPSGPLPQCPGRPAPS